MPYTFPDAPGIYRITCTITGKIYIGSAINLHQRQRDHSSALRRKAHPNQLLQHAWDKYGESTFIFDVIELVLPIYLLEREQYWLDKLKPFAHRKGFNIARLTQSFRLGTKASPETREKLKISHLGQPGYWTGKNHSPETIEKIRLAKREKMVTLIITAPDGTEYVVIGIRKFCREHHLHAGHLVEVAKGEYSQHKGWTARFPETTDESATDR